MKRYEIVDYKRFYVFIIITIMILSFTSFYLIDTVSLYGKENSESLNHFKITLSFKDNLEKTANK